MRAISVRQPHAWAIIHGGKDVENRSQRAAFQFKPAIGERVLIHASKGMTAAEYAVAVAFMASIGVRCPQREGLQFGGVIGSVFVRDIRRRPYRPKPGQFRVGAAALRGNPRKLLTRWIRRGRTSLALTPNAGIPRFTKASSSTALWLRRRPLRLV